MLKLLGTLYEEHILSFCLAILCIFILYVLLLQPLLLAHACFSIVKHFILLNTLYVPRASSKWIKCCTLVICIVAFLFRSHHISGYGPRCISLIARVVYAHAW